MKKLDGATDTDKSGGVMEESEGRLAGGRESETDKERVGVSSREQEEREKKEIPSSKKQCSSHSGEF